MPGLLIVDLDGTLIKSDLLYESVFASFRDNFWRALGSLASIRKGRAFFKRTLAEDSAVDVGLLPYDEQVVDYVRKWRLVGGRTALVTAASEPFAQAVGRHLGLFDEVYGSDADINLKGENKARFLTEKYREGGFTYVGDSTADLAVWRQAEKAVTVNAGRSLRKRVDAIGPPVEHLKTDAKNLSAYVDALRPHQWVKNVLVFLPALAAHQIDGETLFRSLLAFLSFSLIASGVYITNDLLDLSADRAHPRKRNRPFAAGRVPIAHGAPMAFALFVCGGALAASVSWIFFAAMAIYLFTTTAYSLHLKRQIVIDICVLASLYAGRIFAGGVATEIPLSVWLITFSFFLFLSLAAIKRQNELAEGASRGVLSAQGRGYRVDDSPVVTTVALSAGFVSVMVMALYLNTPAILSLYARPETLWVAPVVLVYWITRMALIAHRGGLHDDPIIFAIRDRVSQLCLLAVGAFVLAAA